MSIPVPAAGWISMSILLRLQVNSRTRELRLSQTEHIKSEREKSLILSSIEDLIIFFESPNYRITWNNKAAQKYFATQNRNVHN